MKKFKKYLSALLAAAVIAASFTAGMIAYAGSPVAINSTNFPDANFRTIVQLECDEDGDGYLSDDEISGITLFSVTGYLYDLDEDAEIESLKGIEFFKNLKTLRCGGIGLTSLDVSQLTGLTWLDCMGNELTSLDVSRNTALRTLNCQGNEITSLDVSKLTNLVTLSCGVNKLTALNVSNNTLLETLTADQNELMELNLSNNTALTSLHCSFNHLQELDLSANTLLENVTSNRIGNQTIEGEATVYDGTAYVIMAFNARANIISTSLDDPDNPMGLIAYQNDSFQTTDFAKLVDGIDYEYNVGISDAEPMTVHVNVSRDFFVVNFYTNEQKTTRLAQRIVNRGEDAVAPAITETPQCKTFVAWSGSLTNVQEDRDIWATWKDDHVFKITGFVDNIVILECQNSCGTTMEASFADFIGAELGDSNYNEACDLNYDGIINGRDLVLLKKGNF